MADLKQVV